MLIQLERIRKMNEVFDLPSNAFVTDQGAERLKAFQQVITDEVAELSDAVDDKGNVDMVALADCLTDQLVYILSEMRRWGLPTMALFDAVMNSQDSKLVKGKAVMAADGSKFVKGPHYVPPEPDIELILQRYQRE